MMKPLNPLHAHLNLNLTLDLSSVFGISSTRDPVKGMAKGGGPSVIRMA